MDKLAVLILVFATALRESGGVVNVAFPGEILTPSTGLDAYCSISNETFLGWFKDDGNVKIDVVSSSSAIKDKIVVYVKKFTEKTTAILIFPKGTPTSAGGKYKCKGSETEDFFDLHIRFSLKSLKRQQSLHLGRGGSIVLGALSFPLSTFKWKKDSVAIDFSADRRLTLEKDGSISINKVRLSDAGRYSVFINWNNRVINGETITVHAVEIPKIITTPTSRKVMGIAGDDFKFCCNTTGIPTPTLEWSRVQGGNESEVDVTNVRYSVAGGCMSIRGLQKSDIGTYKCTSTNTAGRVSATVDIERVAGIPDKITNLQATKTCNSFELAWQPPSDNGNLAISKYRIELQANSSMIGLIFVVEKEYYSIGMLEPDTTYLIDIRAINEYLSSPKERIIVTTDKYCSPVIISPQKNKTVSKGEPIRLICNATGHPAPNVSWSKSSGSLKPWYVSGNVLVIPRAELTDAGTYICTAKNTYRGKLFVTRVDAFVTVKLRPHSPVPVSTQITHLSIRVHWKKPESHGYPVLMYSVHRAELDGAGQEVTSRSYHVNEDVHDYEVGGINGGKTYKFYVTAWNTHGESVKDHSKSITVNVRSP